MSICAHACLEMFELNLTVDVIDPDSLVCKKRKTFTIREFFYFKDNYRLHILHCAPLKKTQNRKQKLT